MSFDLILQDYVVDDGIYLKRYRERGFNRSELYFEVDGEKVRIEALTSCIKDYNLKAKQSYIITYAKRSNILISVEAIDS